MGLSCRSKFKSIIAGAFGVSDLRHPSRSVYIGGRINYGKTGKKAVNSVDSIAKEFVFNCFWVATSKLIWLLTKYN